MGGGGRSRVVPYNAGARTPPRPSGYDHDAIAGTRVTSTDTPSAPNDDAPKASAPKIVSLGGGTGSYNLLSGLKHRDCRLTAVVTTMDSGGSSGRLRDEFGHLPPGDLRQCLLALSPDDHSGMVLRGLFNYRFDKGNGLDGHSFGNLFLTALTEITGSAERAIDEMGRLLNIKGRVLPVTLANADLCARLRDGTVIVGETNIDRRGAGPAAPIDHVYLEPSAPVHPPTAAAIKEADAIVIGPGDLYTSIVPNLLVEGVTEALARCRGVRIYVCNLMTKPGESDGFKASDFIREVGRYLGPRAGLDRVIVNDQPLPGPVAERYRGERSTQVVFDEEACRALVDAVLPRPLAAVGGGLVRHDPHRLAAAVFEAL